MSEIFQKIRKGWGEALNWVKSKFLKHQSSVPLIQHKRECVVQSFNPPPVLNLNSILIKIPRNLNLNLNLNSILNRMPRNRTRRGSSGIDHELYVIMNQKPHDVLQKRFKPSSNTSNMNKLTQHKRSVKRPAMKNRQHSRYFR
jgi:hypothetical protein